MSFAEVIFWLAFLVLFFVYIGYPLLLALLASVKPLKYRESNITGEWPKVTLVISAYNEEGVIKVKVENSLAQDYPEDRIRIIVVSDGSTDSTDKVVSEFDSDRVELFRVEGRKGKTYALNQVIPVIDTDIVVFSDANSIYRTDALKNLVAPLQDRDVGGVCGELVYRTGPVNEGSGSGPEGLYWKYEKWIKRNESRLSKVIVFNGSIYAIRKKYHQPMNIEAANDFQHPVQVILQDSKNIYQPEAIAYENEKNSYQTEFNRHVRITLRGWKGLFSYPQVLNPLKVGTISVHFLLRKVLRWLSPLFLISLFVTNVFLLDLLIYRWLFITQLLFYLLAFAGYILARKNMKTLISPIYYFCFANAALLLALIKLFLRKGSAVWTPTSHLE